MICSAQQPANVYPAGRGVGPIHSASVQHDIFIGKVQISRNCVRFTVKKCPTIDVSAVANGKILCTGTNGANSVGANCRIFCNAGYIVVGRSSKVCQPDGFWSGGAALFLCQGVTELEKPI